MNKRWVGYRGCVICLGLLAGLLIFNPVQAHEVAVIGDYTVQYRWRDEPAIVNQPNAVVLTFTESARAETPAGAVASSQLQINPTAPGNSQGAAEQAPANRAAADPGLALTVLLTYEAEQQMLNLAPTQLGSNEYSAEVTPTRAGRYLLRLQGKAHGQPLDLVAPLEAVQASDLFHYLQTIFITANPAALPFTDWVILALSGFGLLTLVLGSALLLKG